MTGISEKLRGIVTRVTYHNPVNGWSVLKVQSFDNYNEQVTVTVHQTKVFAGATMEFHGAWTSHPQFGRQFKATEALERKPASAAALEKYLGSGLISGVGPKIARRIVQHFSDKTLHIFEEDIGRLREVPGIAEKKLETIRAAWHEHRMVRDVMIFLQGHGISTLFAVKIYKKYGEKAIEIVTNDPYRLESDFFGIGFFSADKVALSIGLARDSEQRLAAAVRHILSASREEGHCYLTAPQVESGVEELLGLAVGDRLPALLVQMEEEKTLKVRLLADVDGSSTTCYYAKSLYFEEQAVADWFIQPRPRHPVDQGRITSWVSRYCQKHSIHLSDEQEQAACKVVEEPFSILTGGPGCGKTTTTQVIVRLLEAMDKKVLLAAPTGRAAQRMSEVIEREAKTIHRLLGWQQGGFLHNEEQPLQADFLIVDECSMLDISLTAALLKAVPLACQVLFIGDADQLPSVGAGNVLRDLIASGVFPCFRLTKIFRQAQESRIIQFAHQINRGEIPAIESPFKTPEIWKTGCDCLFLDSDEATVEQLDFVARVKRTLGWQVESMEGLSGGTNFFEFRTNEMITTSTEREFQIPAKFRHVDLEKLLHTHGALEELQAVVKKIHPWSTLRYGLTAVDTVVKLYLEWIPRYQGQGTEIQILTPMTRGSLGTVHLNKIIQEKANPPADDKPQILVGEKIFRLGDRVIHRRNNYDLAVFNGDIGKICAIDPENLTCTVRFFSDNREVEYERDALIELDLAYAITIHKSQGSEFPAVIIPVFTQHFKMLFRNLIYTGLTRARRLAVFVGTRRALAMAVRQQDSGRRQTALAHLIRQELCGQAISR